MGSSVSVLSYEPYPFNTFNLTLINQYFLHIQVYEIKTGGPFQIYSKVLLNPHALQRKGQTEVVFEKYI